MIRLKKPQVLGMHHALIERYGGIHGVRDEGLLDSALQAPYQTFDDIELYQTMIEKAVRLGYGLVRNHPFLDGNKRIGALAMIVLLDLNGFRIKAGSEELTEVFLSIAAGETDDKALLLWVQGHIS